MEWAGAAICHQNIVGCVQTPCRSDRLKGITSTKLKQPHDTLGSLIDIDSNWIGHLLSQSTESSLNVELDSASKEILWVQISENDGAVANCGKLPSPVKADRAWVSSRAFRA